MPAMNTPDTQIFDPAPRLLPTLVIQLQRMGDLVLTFPLLARLRLLEPHRPLWVMAEPDFYKQLMPLTPSGVTYMPPRMASPLASTALHRVINLSHREEGATLAGMVEAESRFGLYRSADKALHTAGVWALYRASLVHNNRHNRLHWADLNCLDVLPDQLEQPVWPPVGGRGVGRSMGRVGLFVGASEREKRPNAAFWGELAVRLAKRGASPVFLGGPGDRSIAMNAARVAGFPESSNLAGRFSIADLSIFLATLDLVVTPDTGPMHVSAWAGVQTLNLSMGPVNPWETAPAPPGHYVLRPTISCTGCWHCPHPVPPCRTAFVPGRVAGLIMTLLQGEDPGKLRLPRLTLYRTTRFNSLFVLGFMKPPPPRTRNMLGSFWKQWFVSALGGAPHSFEFIRGRVAEHSPAMHAALGSEAARIGAALSRAIRRKIGGETLRDTEYWQGLPPLIRPLGGYVQMLLENGEYRPAALHDALALVARFGDDVQGHAPQPPLSLESVRG